MLTRSAFGRQRPEVQILSPRPTCSVSLPAPLARPGQAILGLSVRRREHSPDARDTPRLTPSRFTHSHCSVLVYRTLAGTPACAIRGPGRLSSPADRDRCRCPCRNVTNPSRDPRDDTLHTPCRHRILTGRRRRDSIRGNNTSPKPYNEPCRPRSRVLRCRNDRGEPKLRG